MNEARIVLFQKWCLACVCACASEFECVLICMRVYDIVELFVCKCVCLSMRMDVYYICVSIWTERSMYNVYMHV